MMPSKNSLPTLFNTLQETIQNLVTQFNTIPEARKQILKALSSFIEGKISKQEKIALTFICTHNSRRSHVAQIWAQAAAAYYGIPNLQSYSGGTEATAFNAHAVEALQAAGFKIVKTSGQDNPIYQVSFSDDANEITAFSKRYDSETNPKRNFAAIMTCSHADDNCPVVTGMEKRISLPYDDPKEYDGTQQQAAKYMERVNEIGKEILYAFYSVQNNNEQIDSVNVQDDSF